MGGAKHILRRLANVLAVLFHPVFLSTLVLLVFSWIDRDKAGVHYGLVVAVIVALSLLIPMLTVYIMYKDMYLSRREQRFVPLATSFACSLLLYILLYRSYAHTPFSFAILVLCINAVVLFLLNFRLKLSMHTNAMGIITALYVLAWLIGRDHYNGDFAGWFIVSMPILILLFSLVIWQRLVSGAHSTAELITGYLAGIAAVILTTFYTDFFGF